MKKYPSGDKLLKPPSIEPIFSEFCSSSSSLEHFYRHVQISKSSKLKGLKMRAKSPKMTHFVLKLFEFDLISAFGDEDELYNPGQKGFSIKWLSKMKHLFRLELYLTDLEVLDVRTESLAKILTSLKNLNSLVIYCGGRVATDKALFAIIRCVGKLKNLKEFMFDVTDSTATRSTIIEVSKAIHGMPKLTKLGIGIGDIKFENYEFNHLIKHGLRTVDDLKSFEISLEGRDLTSDYFCRFFSDVISKWENLDHLQIFVSYTGLDDTAVLSLAQKALSKMPKLREIELDFGNNNLSDKSIVALTENFFGKMTNLRKLNLDMHLTSISDKGLSSLVNGGLANMTNLRELAIAFPEARVTEFGINEMISNCISQQVHLEVLMLDFNYNEKITDKFMAHFAEALFDLKNLKMLKISMELTSIMEEGIRRLSELLFNFVELKKLVLSLTGLLLSDDSVEPLAKAIGRLPCLEYCVLNLSEMNLTNSSITSLFKYGFSMCNNLAYLKLIMSTTPISNKGVSTMLRYYEKMKRIERMLLHAQDTKVTEDFVEQALKEHDRTRVSIKL